MTTKAHTYYIISGRPPIGEGKLPPGPPLAAPLAVAYVRRLSRRARARQLFNIRRSLGVRQRAGWREQSSGGWRAARWATVTMVVAGPGRSLPESVRPGQGGYIFYAGGSIAGVSCRRRWPRLLLLS